MKIKDLPKDIPMNGVVFLHPDSKERCIWQSQWQKGVWFKKQSNSNQVFPLAVEKIEDALEFEVAQ